MYISLAKQLLQANPKYDTVKMEIGQYSEGIDEMNRLKIT
ncbi:hypothetical protein FM120_13360 [Sphingobacterium faecium PCAi_F2.5]|jgi:hypothetical protein|nr:hypothetical protein BN1088_1720003 [Sphingobacterium sp. PM2-P1-29]SJN41848.1 hypothetical protein FM120_13360 [Sphingobacterium faecium PCAi_F2.5]